MPRSYSKKIKPAKKGIFAVPHMPSLHSKKEKAELQKRLRKIKLEFEVSKRGKRKAA